MPDLKDAVLIATIFWPGKHTGDSLADEFELDPLEVADAVADLRESGMLQKRRGSPKWSGKDRIRPSKTGIAAGCETLKAEILGG